MEEECGTIPMVLVQNKMDLLYNSAVDRYIIRWTSGTTLLLVDRCIIRWTSATTLLLTGT